VQNELIYLDVGIHQKVDGNFYHPFFLDTKGLIFHDCLDVSEKENGVCEIQKDMI
jgi:hypothetical protein